MVLEFLMPRRIFASLHQVYGLLVIYSDSYSVSTKYYCFKKYLASAEHLRFLQLLHCINMPSSFLSAKSHLHIYSKYVSNTVTILKYLKLLYLQRGRPIYLNTLFSIKFFAYKKNLFFLIITYEKKG